MRTVLKKSWIPFNGVNGFADDYNGSTSDHHCYGGSVLYTDHTTSVGTEKVIGALLGWPYHLVAKANAPWTLIYCSFLNVNNIASFFAYTL